MILRVRKKCENIDKYYLEENNEYICPRVNSG
jgi:hypothetical protein